ncbi:hypothetical protein SCLCIDRAFT_1223444 [Scleroderma citrinum Foug A]|uniref:CipC-like antibiotic response protein n=1 Tax=Scleroderma citrinum Foug A TaxID=1036808 RepID=A0A0C3D9L8_9AGAM|nr:hypothetical protein SCLCIDRAFT_1223444 [Scleroderma citrinum Foug A]
MECAVTWMSTPGFRRTRYGNGNASRLAVYKPLVLWTAGRPITLASHHPINMTREAHEQVLNAPHKAHLSHELIAAAASYEAMKVWNDHKSRNGAQVNHAKMKEFLAAASGGFIDRIVETKGLDTFDKHKAKKHAEGHFN